MSPRRSFESKGFDCNFCPSSYKHDRTRKTHISKKHTLSLIEAVKISREESVEKSLDDGMAVLEDVGAAVDLLNMEPLEEENIEHENTLEESSIVSAVIDSLLNSITPNTTTTTTTPTPTIVPAVPACSEAASFLMLNPEEPIIDLTSSHRTIILPDLPDDGLNDTLEDLQAEANELDEQLGIIGTDPKSICDECGETFPQKTELDKHTKTNHSSPNFQTLDKYLCEDCDVEYTQRKEFKTHMRSEHSGETENEDFELSYLKSWTNGKSHSPDWSAMPPSVEARRNEAIRSKEAKEAAKEEARRAAKEVTRKTKEVEQEPTPQSSEVRDPPLPNLAHWSGSVLGEYLETLQSSMTRQTKLIENLQAKTDWQSKELIKIQTLLITHIDLKEQIVDIENIQEKEPEKETAVEDTETASLEDTVELNTPVVKHKTIYPNLVDIIDITDIDSEEHQVKEKEHVEKKKEKKDRQKAEKKIKIVGDSIVHSMNFERVEKEVGKVSVPGKEGPGAKYNRAYGSRYDHKAQFPNNNQEYKIPQLLAKDKADILIIQASVTDITNLKKVPATNVNTIYGKAAESSEDIVKTAKNALEKDPELQIILMQRPARFDSMADVSEWSNFVLSCKVEEAKKMYGDRLVLGEHSNLHTEEAVEARYGVEGRTPGYDGVHLRGTKGQQAYTDSVIQIMRKHGLGSEEWQVVRGQKGARRKEVRVQEARSQELRANPTITQNRFEPLN